MGTSEFSIRKSFLIPLGYDTLLLVFLTGISLCTSSPRYERAILTIITLITALTWCESFRRKITVTDEGLMIRKYLTTKSIPWHDITRVSCVSLRTRAFVFITTKQRFHIISNAYRNFGPLLTAIVSHLPDTVEVEEEVRRQAASPTKNASDIITAWLAAVVLMAIIWFKLLPPS